MSLSCRAVEPNDLDYICSFPQSAEELYFIFPKATYPLTREQLATAIANRQHSTVLLADDSVIGFANFYHWQPQGCCKIGNFIVKAEYRGQGAGSFLLAI
jgi:predicted GNAT family acetyltransferase